ncbi:MAG TPA: hypothetical protein DCY94_03125 [Firmicutes bacterium]|nr:hypothetical protein [Bacillota bacterium]
MSFKESIKHVWRYAKNEKGYFIIYTIDHILQIIISIVVPILSARQIVNITDNMLYQIILISFVIFGLEIFRNLLRWIANYCSQVMYRESLRRIQSVLGENILRLSNESISKNGSGVFIQRLTGDVSQLADAFGTINMYVSNIVLDIGIFATIFVLNKWIFIYIGIMMFVLFFIEKVRVNARMEEDKKYREKNEKTTGFLSELVRGVRDIKMLNAEESFMDELDLKLIDVNRARYKMGSVNRKYNFLYGSFRDIYDLGLMVLIVYLMFTGSLTAAYAVIVLNYSGRVTSVVNYLGGLMDVVKNFNLSASRVFDIIEGEEFPKEKFGHVHLDKVEGDFEFKNVKFSYEKSKVLKGVSFKIKANETVAFVGKSGAGKTTIFNLLCRMYDVDSGKITIDGVDIKKLDRESIRGNITIISQDPYIFNMTIRDNMRLVKKNVTDEEIEEACKLACLDEYIKTLPDGYDTLIGEGGINLSGGQKQRMAIARALVQKTEIILFDEATSALDNETQMHIQQAIENMKDEYTILIIAHRLSTIINADRIVFLNDGVIEAEGTHKELLKSCPEYKKLYEAEIKK